MIDAKLLADAIKDARRYDEIMSESYKSIRRPPREAEAIAGRWLWGPNFGYWYCAQGTWTQAQLEDVLRRTEPRI